MTEPRARSALQKITGAAAVAATALGVLAVGTPPSHAAPNRGPNPRATARAWLGTNPRLAAADLRPLTSAAEDGTDVERFGQYYRGIPVFGSQYVVRLHERAGRSVVDGGNGDVFSHLDVNTALRPSYGRAAAVVASQIGDAVRKAHLIDHGLTILPTGKGILTRHVTLTGFDADGRFVKREYFVPFGGAKPAWAYDSIDYFDGPVDTTGDGFHGSALPLHLYQRGSSYEFRDESKPMFADHGGQLLTYDAAGKDISQVLTPDGRISPTVPLATSDTVPVPASKNTYGLIDAAWGAGLVYDYYKALGRDSLDGKGGTIKSMVGATQGGGPFPNAFWDGHAMVYGTGGYGFKPFPAELDVIGHEMTHGVVQHTANLVGGGQSGAINEAIADYFGNAIENKALGIPTSSPDSGLMGQDLCLHSTGAACAIRDLNKLKTTRSMYGDPGDGGGVHENSTIVSGSLWQIRKALGDDLADRIVYTALSQYFTPLTDFTDVRRYVVAAARSLHVTASQLAAIDRAFDRHGIKAGWERGAFDSTGLLGDAGGANTVGAGGGRFALAANTPHAHVTVGAADGRGTPHTIARAKNRWYDSATTDGHRVAWAEYGIRDGRPVTRVLSKVLGGPTRTLATYFGNRFISALSVDGDVTAWSLATGFGGTSRSFVDSKGRVRALPRPAHGSVDQVFVKHGRALSVTTDPGLKGKQHLWLTNLATHRRRLLATASAITSPVISGRRVVYLEGGRNAAQPWLVGKAGLVRIGLSGRHRRVLVPRSSPNAPAAFSLSAGGRWVVFSSFRFRAGGLGAVRIGGGPVERVSCSNGQQVGGQVLPSGRIVFIDWSTVDATLRTRRAPAGRC